MDETTRGPAVAPICGGVGARIALSLLGLLLAHAAGASELNIESPRNTGLLRLEMNNDMFFADDSQFSNGFSLQYHTRGYETWEQTRAPAFAKWVGRHFPSLGEEGRIVRYGMGIGQNIVTPGDLTAKEPLEGDIPYAGTLTYSLSWQSYNVTDAATFQLTAGVLGKEAFAEEVQDFVHNELVNGDDPQGWDTQRKTEPVLNFSYQYIRSLARFGTFDGGWAGQLEAGPSLLLGNLTTGAEVGMDFRFGWNIPEGFAHTPAPPGRGVFNALNMPKPKSASASPHAYEIVLGTRVSRLFYSVFYDGSVITDDKREVDREDLLLAAGIGLNYYHYDRFAIRVIFLATSDLLVEESIPDPGKGRAKTEASTSYGSIVVDFPF